MNSGTRFIFILGLGLFFFRESGAQRPLIDPDSYVINTGVFATRYNSVYDNDGERKISPEIMHSGFYLQAEAGLHKYWNLMVNAPLLILNTAEASDVPGGYKEKNQVIKPGDIEAGIKYGFNRNEEWSACLSVWQSLATAYRDTKHNLNTGWDDYYTKAYFNVRYFRSTKWAFQTYMGFNNRNKSYGDEFYAGTSLGLYILKNISFEWNTDGVFPIENGSEEPRLYLFGLYHNNWGVLNTGLELNWKTGRSSSLLTGISIPLKGQYVYSSPVLKLGYLIRIENKPD